MPGTGTPLCGCGALFGTAPCSNWIGTLYSRGLIVSIACRDAKVTCALGLGAGATPAGSESGGSFTSFAEFAFTFPTAACG